MGPPPVKKSNTMLIVIIVIVVVVALVVAGTLLALNAINHTVNSTSDVSMTIVGHSTVPASDYSIAPSAGDIYVQVSVTMTNKASVINDISSIWFSLKASGTEHSPVLFVTTDTHTAVLQVGGSTTFLVSFEVPSSATLEKITYTPFLGHAVSANF